MRLHYTFFIWLVIILFVGYFGFTSLPHSGNFKDVFLQSLANWDGGHYLSIAQNGYKEKFQYAFFPLYPLLIKYVQLIAKDYLLAALLISICSSFLAIKLLYKLIAADFDKKIAENSLIMLLIFPTSFFLLTAYSESLFLLLTVATFLSIREGKLLGATILATLASATRLSGLAVSLALIIGVMSEKGINKRNWYVIFAPAGFIIYCWYLFIHTSDPFYFITAENHWLRTLVVPGISFWEAIKSLISQGVTSNFNLFLDLLFAIFGLGLVLRSFRFLPISYSFYSFFSILLPLFTPQLSSMPRFLLTIWPIFILMALVKNKYILFAYQLISIMLLGIFVAMFINGFWVA